MQCLIAKRALGKKLGLPLAGVVNRDFVSVLVKMYANPLVRYK